MTKFKYNGRLYNPVNLEKKLKKMNISIDDIEIIKEDTKEEPIDTSIVKHHFKLSNGFIVTSIYNNLNDLGITDYEQID